MTVLVDAQTGIRIGASPRSTSAVLLANKVFPRLVTKTAVTDDDSCWLWRGHLRPDGYGRLSVGNRTRFAHRVMYEECFGPIPEGLIVCHTCDTPGCVRPEHLFLGTWLDNSRDMVAKGRYVKGRTAKPCRHCGRRGRFYYDEPDGYLQWHAWAERKSRTHHQERCPGCGRFSVWRLGAAQGDE